MDRKKSGKYMKLLLHFLFAARKQCVNQTERYWRNCSTFLHIKLQYISILCDKIHDVIYIEFVEPLGVKNNDMQ